MADNNSILVNLDLDTKELEKQFKQVQSRLKNMTGISSGLTDSPRDMQMKQAFQRSEGMHKERLLKMYEKQDKIIDDLLKKEKELSEKLDGKIKNQKKLNELQQEYLQTTEAIRRGIANQQGISQSLSDDGGGGKGGGGKGGGGILPGGGGIGGKLTALIGAVGSITTVASQMADMADFINRRRGQYSAERSASLAESMYAPSRRAIRDKGFDDLLYAEEKNKAFQDTMGMGQEQFGINRGKARMFGVSGTAAIGLGALALLAAPFTGGGSLALAGAGLAGMAGGGMALSANKGMGYEAMFGDIGEVDKMTGQQMMEYYKSRQAAEKAKDPTLTMLKDFVSENRMDMIKGIRGSGMSEQEYLRRYVQGYGMAGSEDFGLKQRMGMTDQMLAAGGGSGAAYGQNMITALQAQRGLGLTNAGQTMGRLSNYLNAQESEEAFVKILGKGVSIGLDKSQYREEQKDYFNQVTAIAQNIGAGEQLISSIMTAAIGGEGDISRKNVQFAADAAKDVMGDLSKQTGRIGAQKYRQLNKNPMLKGLSKEDRFFLGQMDAADIEAGNPELEMYWRKSGAKEKGISIEEFAKSIRGDFSKAVTGGFGKMTKRYESIDKMLSEGIDEEGNPLSEEVRSDLEVEKTRLYSFMADKQGTYKARRARARGLSGFEGKMKSEKSFEDRMSEYNQLKTNEQFLDEKQKARLKDLEGTSVAFRATPMGGLEKGLAYQNRMGQQERRATTEGGKDLAGVVSDFADNLDKALAMSVKERQILKGFQKALEDGVPEVIKAIVESVTNKSFKSTGQKRASMGSNMNSSRASTNSSNMGKYGR